MQLLDPTRDVLADRRARSPRRGTHSSTSRARRVIGVDGVDGAWIVPAGPPDFDAPGSPTAKAKFGARRRVPARTVRAPIAATRRRRPLRRAARARRSSPMAAPPPDRRARDRARVGRPRGSRSPRRRSRSAARRGATIPTRGSRRRPASRSIRARSAPAASSITTATSDCQRDGAPERARRSGRCRRRPATTSCASTRARCAATRAAAWYVAAYRATASSSARRAASPTPDDVARCRTARARACSRCGSPAAVRPRASRRSSLVAIVASPRSSPAVAARPRPRRTS